MQMSLLPKKNISTKSIMKSKNCLIVWTNCSKSKNKNYLDNDFEDLIFVFFFCKLKKKYVHGVFLIS